MRKVERRFAASQVKTWSEERTNFDSKLIEAALAHIRG
jgi:hypothetical protein